MTSKSDAVVAALEEIIEKAPREQQAKLAEAMEIWAYTYPQTFRDLTKGNKLVSRLLSIMEEASEAIIQRDHFGNPDKDF